jgi:hypothetical protein
LTFSGHPVSPEFDFGVAPSSYVFVRTSRFLNPDLPRHVVPTSRAATLLAASTVINNYSVVNNKIINGGISRGVVAAAAKEPVPEVALEPVLSAPEIAPAPLPLLASARAQDSGWPSMQLPPLHYPAAPSASVKHEFVRGFGVETSGRPVFRGSELPPLPGPRPRFVRESRSAAPGPIREVAAAAASGAKSAK